MGNYQYDIIVVGAGCAGPAAAKKAAELGLKVLLLEKSQKPGEKNVSGTCLNMAALVDPDLQYLMKGPIEREITEMHSFMISPERTTMFREIPGEGLILLSVRRDEFDAWHTEQAKKAGAEVKLSTTIVDIIEEDGTVKGVITDSGDKYFGKVIIDAAGVNSIVGRKAGLIPKRKGTNMILYTILNVWLGEEKVTERFGNSIYYFLAPNCQYKTWPWIFPKKEVVTIGTGGYMDENLFNGDIKSVNDYMQNLIDLPIIKEKLEGGRVEAWGLHLEFDQSIEKRTKAGLILTGEAGGFVIPFLGEGMPEAFFTGIYAAEAAAKAIEANDFSEEFLEEHFMGRYNENVFLQSFRYVADMNKQSILSMPDEEIIAMMQNICIGGGFISSAIHRNWMKGADEDDMSLVQDAKDFYEFIQPYRQVGSESLEIYKKMRAEK
ncbi:MAG TPA: NAD(P)/FAD-dependent oxidoreductase [candidate division Zixibacteria bacterium]|nr:NAD(P)/FAD-dependent oxidoreductase [candidate division Zixibacteria bacterium]